MRNVIINFTLNVVYVSLQFDQIESHQCNFLIKVLTQFHFFIKIALSLDMKLIGIFSTRNLSKILILHTKCHQFIVN